MEWISVEDRLPMPTVPVLVHIVYSGGVNKSKYIILIAQRTTNGKDWLCDRFPAWGKIIHWMPLPEPPK